MSKASEHRGRDWDVQRTSDGKAILWEAVDRILLQEIRDGLVKLNASIDQIRHFFHQPGMATGVREALRRENARANRHRAQLRARRRRQRERAKREAL